MPENVNDVDKNWQIAICLGLDMTQADAAERLGMTRQTIYNRTRADATFFDTAIPFVQAVRAMRFEQKVQEVVGPAETRIKAMFDRSFRLSEKLLTKAEEEGDDVSYERLLEIHKNFTVWASEYATSKAPKRLKLEGRVDHEHVLVIPLSEAQNVIATRAMLAQPTIEVTAEAAPNA